MIISTVHRWVRHSGVARDRGMVSIWLSVLAMALIAVMGMVVDSGAGIRAADQADIAAGEAARAAVIGVGPRASSSQGGAARAAEAAAGRYLAQAGLAGHVQILGPDRVRVTVTATARGPITGRTYVVTREHTATLLVGVERGP